MTPEEYKINKTIYEEKCEELEVYKKALDLAIQTNDMVRNKEKWKALLLKEAREQG